MATAMTTAIIQLMLVTLASVLLCVAPLVEAGARCGIEPINWGCEGPNVTANLCQDCSAREGKKVFKFVKEEMTGCGWPSVTTSSVMQEYVRVFLAIELGMETCSWYNRMCILSCGYTCGPCMSCCLAKFERCRGQDPNDCCKCKPDPCVSCNPTCNGTANGGGRKLLADDQNNIKGVVVHSKTDSDKKLAEDAAGKLKAGAPKGNTCVACATGTLPGGSDGSTEKYMACARSKGEGPTSNVENDPSTPKS